jgi:hypothetical protein
VEPERAEGQGRDQADLTTAAAPKANAYPPRRSALAIGEASSRSSVPPERSRNTATEVMTNITVKGNTASSIGPVWSKTPG